MSEGGFEGLRGFEGISIVFCAIFEQYETSYTKIGRVKRTIRVWGNLVKIGVLLILGRDLDGTLLILKRNSYRYQENISDKTPPKRERGTNPNGAQLFFVLFNNKEL